MRRTVGFAWLLPLGALCIVACARPRSEPRTVACGAPAPGLTVAFLGDQGLGPDAVAVLELIRSRGADAVVHSGDFDYADDPAAWDAQIDAALGADFPYFASVGNHDESAWDGPEGYQAKLEARLRRLGIAWEGRVGVAAHIQWQGLSMVFVSPGIFQDGETESAPYLREHFAHSACLWRVASWHKNQRSMQTGDKGDAVGWSSYEEARRAGAIIATAHEHSYARTHLLSAFATQAVAQRIPPGSSLALALARDDPGTPADEGRAFAFVAGLGGETIRDQQRSDAWFASIYTADQGARPGALFCTFHVHADPGLAHCWFEDVGGNVPDEFWVAAPVARS
jgi:hypothetical protein